MQGRYSFEGQPAKADCTELAVREVLNALARVEPAVPADVRRDLTGTGIRNGRVRGEKKDLMQEVVRLAGDRTRWRAFIHSGAKFRREKKGGGG